MTPFATIKKAVYKILIGVPAKLSHHTNSEANATLQKLGIASNCEHAGNMTV